MINLLIALTATLLATFIFQLHKLQGLVTEDKYGDFKLNPSIFFKKVVPIIVIFFGILIFNPISVQRIDAGSVGLKIDRVGNDKGIPVARPCKGWVFYNVWTTDVVEYSIRQQHVVYTAFQVPTKGGTPMDVAPSFNYALKPEKASAVYINLLKGGDFDQLKNTWMATATTIALKNATNEFPIDSIFNHQSIYQKAVENELNKELSAYFIVSQINPGQITPASMKQILQDKANAIQGAQQSELNRQKAVAQAQADIAKARGDSAANVIQAAGEAEAIRLKTREISENYVQYVKWLNCNPDVPRVPSTVLGSGTSVLLSK